MNFAPDTDRPEFVRAYLAGSRAARDRQPQSASPYERIAGAVTPVSRFIRDLQSWWMRGWRERKALIEELNGRTQETS